MLRDSVRLAVSPCFSPLSRGEGGAAVLFVSTVIAFENVHTRIYAFQNLQQDLSCKYRYVAPFARALLGE